MLSWLSHPNIVKMLHVQSPLSSTGRLPDDYNELFIVFEHMQTDLEKVTRLCINSRPCFLCARVWLVSEDCLCAHDVSAGCPHVHSALLCLLPQP